MKIPSLIAAITLSACSSGALTQAALPGNSSAVGGSGDAPFASTQPVRRLCSAPISERVARCFAMVRTDLIAGMRADAPAVQSGEVQNCRDLFSSGYCPIDLQQAYHFPSLSAGEGKLVAIVDAYGYKHAAGDLAEYRKTMGLRACSLGSCLRIVNQNGASSPLPAEPPPGDDWKGEQSLDLDMVSAICPNCKIVLVQANDDAVTDLYDSVQTAGRLGAKYVGASWGLSEFGGDDAVFHQTGVVIAAAAGDDGGGGDKGGGPQQPCSYTYVVCVGGTHLVRADDKRGWSETVWNDWTDDQCGGPCGATGSGCSKRIAKPSWQTDKQCRMRSESDISVNASLRSPVIVYNSEEDGGTCPTYCFWLYGGTSASTQIIAAAFALAGNAGSQVGASGIWKRHEGNVFDVIAGNNLDAQLGVTCASTIKYICTAQFGFDGPTGWGTPNGIGAL
jgi:subtilase family serine protease